MLHPPHDLRALGAAVTSLATSPQVRRTMGEAARRTALTRTWDGVCDQLLGHYATVVARRAGGRAEADLELAR